jgi:two-component system nitrogen regulation sensor histidine kinase NtrY
MVFLGSENADIKPLSPTPQVMEEVFAGNEVSLIQPLENGEFISGLVPIYSNAQPSEAIGAVVVSYYIPQETVDKISVVSKASEQYGQMQLMKKPIKISYRLHCPSLRADNFFCNVFGLFMAKGITVPILDLAEATKRIARGDLNHQSTLLLMTRYGCLSTPSTP